MKHRHSAKCRKYCWQCFLFTAGFYIEHFTAEKLVPFVYLTHALGL